ncbi:HD domain-containing protein [Intrasporangium calvum]|uniref:HD domain-containing protein n=1 Tax=Intrasporangium calvum TaxID=53358 RepID=A0ABT5GN52_9MICO|nr:HD domain-containing phosphohydrolase [Intrasporangium calvum]MDC5699315.1 HD domain-containing protein [Intrasporangium calvum]
MRSPGRLVTREFLVRGYITVVTVAALGVGVMAWQVDSVVDLPALTLLVAMGVLSFQLREPDVGSRIGFSFLSIILLASAAIVGPLGTWAVGLLSVTVDRREPRWSTTVFNMAMTSIVGAAGALAYDFAGGLRRQIEALEGAGAMTASVGIPILVADVVGCLTNAVLLAGVIHYAQGVPFTVVVRRVLSGSGWAYVGYGVIGFLFVVLWFPARLGAFSALLVLAPLLAARWAFIQYGDELRSHERTLDTLVTALGKKEPPAIERSRRTARLSEWLAEELGLGPHQIGTVRQAATLHEIGHLAIPARTLRRSPDSLTDHERRLLTSHGVVGARMVDGIDFLDEARAGIRHQHERFDGHGGPGSLSGADIPISARIIAVAGAFTALTQGGGSDGRVDPDWAVGVLDGEVGRYDPGIVDALRRVLAKHEWSSLDEGEA